MVKGISRQVIVVDTPDPRLFEQAIFILKDEALGEGITDDQLLKEAQKVIRGGSKTGKHPKSSGKILWATLGAGLMGIAWVISSIL